MLVRSAKGKRHERRKRRKKSLNKGNLIGHEDDLFPQKAKAEQVVACRGPKSVQISLQLCGLISSANIWLHTEFSGGKRWGFFTLGLRASIIAASTRRTKSSLRGIQQGSARSLTGKWIHSHSFGFLKTSPISNRRRVSLSRLSLPAAAACVGVLENLLFHVFLLLNKKRDHESKFRSELCCRDEAKEFFLFHFVFCVRDVERGLCCRFVEPLAAGVSGYASCLRFYNGNYSCRVIQESNFRKSFFRLLAWLTACGWQFDGKTHD